MLDDVQLEQLLRDPESDRVERKASISEKDRICEAICAFANDLPDHRQPGIVFVGANDDGSCSQLSITDHLLLTLASMRSDGKITPFPTMSVGKRILAGCEMAVIEVQPSDAPPVRFRGRIWIRVGPRRAIATNEEERRLTEKRRFKEVPFDIRPMTSASLDDLDLDFFERTYLPAAIPSEILGQNQRSTEQQLMSLRLISTDPEPVPTVLGLLAIGKDVRGHLPGAYVQFLRLDGTKLTDPIKDQKEIDGPINVLLQRLDDTLHAHISTALDITSRSTELRIPDYPMAALKQLINNAVLHRTYEGTNAPVRVTWFSDRIEILSPGGPFGQVTQENFGQSGLTDYRNPHLAEAMKDLGYVQRFGMGILIAREALSENGNPPPEFNAQPAHVLVTLRARS